MKIKIMLPIYASAEFEADIDIKGKTAEDITEEFYSTCNKTGFLCHQCARSIETDYNLDEEHLETEDSQIVQIIKENKN